MIVKFTITCDYCKENSATIPIDINNDFTVNVKSAIEQTRMFLMSTGHVVCLKCKFKIRNSGYRGYN